MAEPRHASSRPSPASRRSSRLPLALPIHDLRADLRPRVVLGASVASLAILAASVPTGFGLAGSILVGTLWIRVGADAVTVG